eukprot:CAMPEP_0201575584 /NCGR_PEP_ID=MMETSP0190_2-20130828/20876_1 /ASSEMBLY_ACC=CAM_ASM_000263 /TAXON_ID=37353 /ORGANISM="Rosalina sp." /LENGTH=318 /DNA_ID=CAMNT_0048005403 /DNA_START=85 /DNA_END=1038 /DNA_ORIENTATION=+
MKPTGSNESFVHKAKAELERQRSLKKAKSQGQLIPASAPVTPRDHEQSGNKPGQLKRAATTNALFDRQSNGSVVSINAQPIAVTKNQPSNYANLPGYDINEGDNESDSEFDSSNEIDLTANDSMMQASANNEDKSQIPIKTMNDTMESRLLGDEDNNTAQLHAKQISVASTSINTDSDFYDNYEQHSLGSDDSDEGPTTLAGKFMHWFTMPLQILFKLTCPPAGEGESCEKLYGVTFAISVVHVAIFSFILSSIVGAWVTAWGMPQALFGMLLIAIGAEIPDTIESVTMARKTYGSMAVSNCQGTQVINIGIGLGLPW